MVGRPIYSFTGFRKAILDSAIASSNIAFLRPVKLYIGLPTIQYLRIKKLRITSEKPQNKILTNLQRHINR